MVYIALVLSVVLPMAWIYSEFHSNRWLRITLGISSFALSFLIAWATVTLSRLNCNAWYSCGECLDRPKSLASQSAADMPRQRATSGVIARSNDKVIEALKKRNSGFFEGELDVAIASLSKVIQADPKNGEAYHNRGVAYCKKGDIDKAIADLNDAIRLNPTDKDALYFRGRAYQQKAGRLDVSDAKTFYLNGLAYQRNKILDQAVADLTQVIKLDPKDTEAYWMRGSVYHQKDDLDRAIADYTAAIAPNPNDPFSNLHQASAYYNRAIAYGKRGELDKAIADYAEAIRLNPSDRACYENRANVYRKKGENAKAAEDLARAKKRGG